MSASTPNAVVVEIDGLYFRIGRYRARRATRGMASLIKLMGGSFLQLLADKNFASLEEGAQLEAITRLLITSKITGGQGLDPNVFESVANELFCFEANHSQGLCVSGSRLDAGAQGWLPMSSLASLDDWDQADHTTALALLWEIIKLNFRPTMPGSGTAEGTGPGESTSPNAGTKITVSGSPGGSSPSTGSPSTPTPRRTGVSGG